MLFMVTHYLVGSRGGAKRMPPLSLLLPPFLQYYFLIDVEALQYVPHPIKPLTAMVLGRQIQERAGSEEGR